MSQFDWLPTDFRFPDISDALEDPNGLLAVGGDLSFHRLMSAYRHGIFPWYEEGQPILWWSPDPRCVIEPASFRPSRTLKKRLRRGEFEIRVDTAFESVMRRCRTRHGEIAEGTWITPAIIDAYCELHRAGFAHSIEVWQDGALVGGLYGVSLGRLFFGESMFHLVTDASKVAFAGLMGLMTAQGCPLVDCQITNPHLVSLGTIEMPREAFRHVLETWVDAERIDWPALTGLPRICLNDLVIQTGART